LNALEPEKKRINQEINRLKMQLRNVGKKIVAERNSVQNSKREIKGLNQKKSKSMNNEDKEQFDARTQLQEEIEKLREDHDAAKREYTIAFESKQDYNRENPLDEQSLRSLKDEAARLKQEEKNMRKAQHSRIDAYGPEIVKLRKSIEQEKRWKNRPIGPLGMEIDVQDKNAVFAIESALKQQITAFAVTNHDDRRLLQSLVNENKIKMMINIFTQSPGPRYNTPQVEGVTTVQNMITIASDLVFNVLVDQANIESLALAQSDEEARNMVAKHRQLKSAYTPNGAQFQFRDGSHAFSSYSNRSPPKLAGFDPAQLQKIGEDIRLYEDKIKGKQAEINETQAQIREHEKNSKQASALMQSTKKELASKRHKVTELEANMDIQKEETEFDDEIERLQNEIRECEDIIREQESEEETTETNLKVVEQQYNEHLEKMQEMDASLMVDTSGIENDLREANQSLNAAKIDQKDRIAEKQNFTVQLEKRMAKKEEVRGELQTNLESAPKLAKQSRVVKLIERPAASEKFWQISSTDLWTKHVTLASRAKTQAKDTGVDPVAAESALRAQLERVDKLKSDAAKLADQIQKSEAQVQKRIDSLKDFQKRTAKKLKRHFKIYLSKRGHTGSVNINFGEKTLSFDVKLKGTDDGTEERPAKKAKKTIDTKTLSGGERAFITVAFLLALGEAMECPFRAMDEFDCFMDAANRNVSIKQLITTAKNQSHRQFIFLTPLSLTKAIKDCEKDPQVGLWQLKPPSEQVPVR